MIFDGKKIKLEDMTEHPFIYFYRNLFIFLEVHLEVQLEV